MALDEIQTALKAIDEEMRELVSTRKNLRHSLRLLYQMIERDLGTLDDDKILNTHSGFSALDAVRSVGSDFAGSSLGGADKWPSLDDDEHYPAAKWDALLIEEWDDVQAIVQLAVSRARVAVA
jgi:hypothetical protein